MQIFVSNLNYQVTEPELDYFLSERGIEADRIQIGRDRESGKSRGFAFVDLPSEQLIPLALALDGKEFLGRRLNVQKARAPGDWPNRGRRRPHR